MIAPPLGSHEKRIRLADEMPPSFRAGVSTSLIPGMSLRVACGMVASRYLVGVAIGVGPIEDHAPALKRFLASSTTAPLRSC